MSQPPRLAFGEHGSDHDLPPLVLIHGAGGNRYHWPPQIRRLPGARIFSLDLPGHGQSKGTARDSIQAYAERVLAWQTCMDLPRVIPVGHSMGGGIALQMALLQPDQIAALVLVGSGARLRVHPDLLQLTGAGQAAQALDWVIQWAFSQHASPELTSLARKHMDQVPAQVLHADYVACDAFDVMDQIDQIVCPVLALCGEDDRMTPAKYSRYLVEHMAEARFQLVPRAGHMVMLEQPQQVATALGDFLQDLQP